MTSKLWMGAQTLAIVALLGWSGWSHLRIGALEAELAAQPNAPASTPARVVLDARPVAAAQQGARPAGEGVEAVEVAAVDDHLWSEEGRAAIDDVVAEREEREGERRADMWRKMQEARTTQMLGAVASELQLSDADVAELEGLVEAYQELKSQQWRRMKEESDADPVALMKEGEQARDDFEADLKDLLGEDGAAMVQEKLRWKW